MNETISTGTDDQARGIAQAFVAARRAEQPLETYPGDAPANLDAAYTIQDRAIGLWNQPIGGWKVGRIPQAAAAALGTDRLAGPIFTHAIAHDTGNVHNVTAIKGGFMAVEGEAVVVLGADAPADKIIWTIDEAAALIGAVHAGIEFAGSPYARINDDGPLVTISDFGNNHGLLIGAELPNWRALDYDRWHCRTVIDGQTVGENAASVIPGGPLESLRFLLNLTARRGMPLKRGMAVSTGAITGVHEISIGQSASVAFDGLPTLRCAITSAGAPAKPMGDRA